MIPQSETDSRMYISMCEETIVFGGHEVVFIDDIFSSCCLFILHIYPSWL